jgi:hypothetical protein
LVFLITDLSYALLRNNDAMSGKLASRQNGDLARRYTADAAEKTHRFE